MEQRYINILIFVLVVVLLFSGWFFIYKKSCKTDDCFNDALYNCKPAKYYSYRTNNLYYYKISRSLGDCKLNIKVVRVAPGSDPSMVKLLEGKSMTCKIPSEVEVSLDNMENLLDYCHGYLKEGLYRLMIEKLYAIVVRDMSNIIDKAKDVLKV
jgi:hypothetical protein